MKTQLNQISTHVFLFHIFSFIDFEDTYPWREWTQEVLLFKAGNAKSETTNDAPEDCGRGAKLPLNNTVGGCDTTTVPTKGKHDVLPTKFILC